MKLTDFIVRRLVSLPVTLFGVIILMFFIARILPGDPVRAALGELASEEMVEHMRRELWLDRPIYMQFYKYLGDLSRFSLGTSITTYRDVVHEFLKRLPASFELISVSMLISIFLGVLLGVTSALTQNRRTDYVIRTFSMVGICSPRFVVALLLQLVFSFYLSMLPLRGRIDIAITPFPAITGLYLVDSLLCLRFDAFVSSLQHIMLPAIALAFPSTAKIYRIVRGGVLEEMKKQYITTLQANGMPRNVLINKYVLRSSFSAALTTIGLIFGSLMGGAFMVETVFSWPGLASFIVDSILLKDINVMIAAGIVTGIIYSIINLITDFLYGYLDPRVARGYVERH